MIVAEQEGVYAFGQASDMIAYGPNAQLTSIIDNWAPYYILRTKNIIDGIRTRNISGPAYIMSRFPEAARSLARKPARR